MSILLWIVVGAIIGWLASLIAGTNETTGILGNVLIGIVGAFLGGLIAQAFGFGPINVLTFGGFVFALLGALILIGIVRAVRQS